MSHRLTGRSIQRQRTVAESAHRGRGRWGRWPQYVVLVRHSTGFAIVMNSNRTGQLLGLVMMVLSGFETRGQVAKELNLSPPSTNSIAGLWKATATLADFGDIFQPHHGVRRRVALVNFKLEG
jgi:hypothetical protein